MHPPPASNNRLRGLFPPAVTLLLFLLTTVLTFFANDTTVCSSIPRLSLRLPFILPLFIMRISAQPCCFPNLYRAFEPVLLWELHLATAVWCLGSSAQADKIRDSAVKLANYRDWYFPQEMETKNNSKKSDMKCKKRIVCHNSLIRSSCFAAFKCQNKFINAVFP